MCMCDEHDDGERFASRGRAEVFKCWRDSWVRIGLVWKHIYDN